MKKIIIMIIAVLYISEKKNIYKTLNLEIYIKKCSKLIIAVNNDGNNDSTGAIVFF